jgi:hypothetical protein
MLLSSAKNIGDPWVGSNVMMFRGEGGPNSGTTGTGFGVVPPGAFYQDRNTGTLYVNEGTKASPYWTPVSFSQPNLLGVYEDFRGPAVKAIADTTTGLNAASGIRTFGQGIAETDSGCVKGTDVEGSHVGNMRTTNEDEHVVALGMGTSVAVLQPDTHGPLVVDVLWSQLTNILTRRIFVGFTGEAADAMDPVATGATTVITFSSGGTTGDDMAGIFMDANMTDADALYLAHNKSNAAATIATTATGVDLSTNLAAAATYQRMRVEVDLLGNVRAFVDKTQVALITTALDVDEELLPVVALMVESGTTIMQATVKQFSCWGNRA